MTLSLNTSSIMTLNIKAFSILTLSVKTLSIMTIDQKYHLPKTSGVIFTTLKFRRNL